MLNAVGEEVVAPLCAPSLARGITGAQALRGLTLIESDNKKVRWDIWFAADRLGVALESLRLRRTGPP